jgi:predicted ATPase
MRGALLLELDAQQNRAEAEASLNRAIEIARRQQARLPELRAMIDLARLWQQEGRHVEARERLEAILSWFNEGFDTLDLEDGQALLAELDGAPPGPEGRMQ